MSMISERLREIATRDTAKAVTVRASDALLAADTIDWCVAALDAVEQARLSDKQVDWAAATRLIDIALAKAKGKQHEPVRPQ